MDRVIKVATPAGGERQITIKGCPDTCPRCHTSLVPKHIGSVARSVEKENDIEEAFQCTSASCGGLFVATYRHEAYTGSYHFFQSFPVEFREPIVGDLLKDLSPTFFETYGQSLRAESLGMTQVTGIGLRKALEFLVKDFAIKESPDQRDAIVRKMLGQCITDHIADHSVQNLARRAAWLGNDEAHYLRQWEDRDVSDLKLLLRLTMNAIENRLLERKYVEEMPEGLVKPS